jgi:hypothetical protein
MTRVSLALISATLGACATGGASYPTEASYAQAPPPQDYGGDGYGGEQDASPSPMAYAAPPSSGPSAEYARGRMVAANTAATPAATTASTTPVQPPTATDVAPIRSLIVYTANVVIAIYEVDATQRQIVTAVQGIGGFVASLDENSVVVRVPAAEFESFLATVEATGRVIGRTIRADDITEQFRDLEIRMQNLVAMRARLEQMLSHAANVAEALAVERELERVTAELESMRGRLRYLSDRVAFSTITIQFRALPREQLAGDTPPAPPIPWLHSIGLGNLLQN